MDNILKLLDQHRDYEVFMILKNKVLENIRILENLFDLNTTIIYSEEENNLIRFLRNFIGTKNDWLFFFIRDSVFYEIRDIEDNKKLVDSIKQKLSKTHKDKTITLHENQWTEVKLTHPDDDLPKVKIELSFDREFFKIKAEVKDKHFLDGNRSWRYGDGFFMNFTMPEDEEKNECIDTQYFYGLGFSMEEGIPRGVLVNHNGTYYLGFREELTPEIKIDTEEMIAYYDIKIPFDYLKPFNPLIDNKSGFYIRYISQIEENYQKSVYLIEDSNADSEMTNYRRFVPVKYLFSDESPIRIAGKMDNRLVTADFSNLEIYFYTPEKTEDTIKIQIFDKNQKLIKTIEKSISLNKGKNILTEKINTEDLKSELYNIKVNFKEETWEQVFYNFKPNIILEINEKIQSLEKLGNNNLIQNSIHSLNFRLHQIENIIDKFHPRENPKEIYDKFEELYELINDCKRDKSIFNRTGYLRSAIKSPFDNSLQPYSLLMPEGFELEREYILMVNMHGSGVDEVGFIKAIGKQLAVLGYTNILLIAPRGRDLSDNWIGQSEQDIEDIIKEIKKMFKIKKTLIMGFSMGGYGTWRMTFLHPNLFDGAIIAAGFPHFDGKAENDMRNFIGKSKNIDYLVIHGTADRSVSIKSTDEFIENLKNEGYSMEYHRLEGMDHGNLDMGEIIARWLKKHIK
ncbi:MAG TPA: hypothetical protein VMZ29_01295 [Candidatus Bathyarchaeia archaeon]|nr:hypothetical protein [Candidatus Bathyarchaeia archaeon]